MSCHQNWNGFGMNTTTLNLHSGITAASATPTSCTTCHAAGGSSTKTTVTAFHNGARTERGGLIWDGDDQSVELGKTVRMAITGTSVAAGQPRHHVDGGAALWHGTWTPVNPCNTDFAVGPGLLRSHRERHHGCSRQQPVDPPRVRAGQRLGQRGPGHLRPVSRLRP
jgi:hypothetical protein